MFRSERLAMAMFRLLCEKRGLGPIYAYSVARTRYIDDILRVCLSEGIEQAVILGAGLDSRAFRAGELNGRVSAFEVDHPATQRVKVKRLKKVFGVLPGHVVFIPIDFNRQRLDEILLGHGYDPGLKTLFIWEGVTMYIGAKAVDETLAFIAANSGTGSSVVFDHIFPSVVGGTCDCQAALKLRALATKAGEPFTFGLEPDAIEEFLSDRGFELVDNATGDQLTCNYFDPLGRTETVTRYAGFVHAKVARKP
jgi:methyltransferase (TIGR00027 family)